MYPYIDICTDQALTLAQLWGVRGYTEHDVREIYRLSR
jgi:hypothetical protein